LVWCVEQADTLSIGRGPHAVVVLLEEAVALERHALRRECEHLGGDVGHVPPHGRERMRRERLELLHAPDRPATVEHERERILAHQLQPERVAVERPRMLGPGRRDERANGSVHGSSRSWGANRAASFAMSFSWSPPKSPFESTATTSSGSTFAAVLASIASAIVLLSGSLPFVVPQTNASLPRARRSRISRSTSKRSFSAMRARSTGGARTITSAASKDSEYCCWNTFRRLVLLRGSKSAHIRR